VVDLFDTKVIFNVNCNVLFCDPMS